MPGGSNCQDLWMGWGCRLALRRPRQPRSEASSLRSPDRSGEVHGGDAVGVSRRPLHQLDLVAIENAHTRIVPAAGYATPHDVFDRKCANALSTLQRIAW